MDLFEVIGARYSVRGYEPEPVDDATLEPRARGGAPGADGGQPPTVSHRRRPHREAARTSSCPSTDAPLVRAGAAPPLAMIAVPGEAWRRIGRQALRRVDAHDRHGPPRPGRDGTRPGHLLDRGLRPRSGARGAGPAWRGRAPGLHSSRGARQAPGRHPRRPLDELVKYERW